jgi:hypothetical protein
MTYAYLFLLVLALNCIAFFMGASFEITIITIVGIGFFYTLSELEGIKGRLK